MYGGSKLDFFRATIEFIVLCLHFQFTHPYTALTKMEITDNPYTILGISSDASEDAIKKAYRQAARIHHPDKQSTPEDRERANTEFARLADAYNLLQDPVRRYDWRMANEGKAKISPKKTPAPFKSTPSTSSPVRTPIRPRQSVQTVPKRTNPLPTETMRVQKKASVPPNSVRVSPPTTSSKVRPSSRTSTVRTSAPPMPKSRPSVSASPSRHLNARRPTLNRMYTSMRISKSADSDMNKQHRPEEGKMSMRTSRSVGSEMNMQRRPEGARRKIRGSSVPRKNSSRSRNSLDDVSIPRTKKSGRTIKANRNVSDSSRVRKSLIRPGAFPDSRSVASTRSRATTGGISLYQ
eukprot:scaffold575_cov104-Cylindrotheca_fusiformis.AAC.9